MRESAVEKKVCAYAKKKGMEVYKFVSPGRSGVPDRMFIYNGCVCFIEFKAPGKKPTSLQKHEIQVMHSQCVRVAVIDNVEAGIDFLAGFANE